MRSHASRPWPKDGAFAVMKIIAQLTAPVDDTNAELQWSTDKEHVTISDARTQDAVYGVAKDEFVRTGILKRRQMALDHESANTTDVDSIHAINR